MAKNEIRIRLVDAGDKPVNNVLYEIRLPGGSTRTGSSDADGVIDLKDLPESGDYDLVLHDFDPVAE